MGLCHSKGSRNGNYAGITEEHRTRAIKESGVSNSFQAQKTTDSSTLWEDKHSSNDLNHAGASKQRRRPVKTLLMGTGESGKSTILQQLKILHQNGFTDDERNSFKPSIYENMFGLATDLINICLEYDTLPPELNDDIVKELLSYSHLPYNDILTMDSLPQSICQNLPKIWSYPPFQKILNGKQRSEIRLMDTAEYFMASIKRVCGDNYLPTDSDIVHSRHKTSGIFDTTIEMGSGVVMHLYDIGGQRSERKKWIHCFNNVDIIIFCAALSEYDQYLNEDATYNRFEEALVLFDSVINSRWFARTKVILLLNKVDLFAEKLENIPLEIYFPDYKGGQDIDKATKYVLWRFAQLNRSNLKIYPYVTQATNTLNMQSVFAAVTQIIIENKLGETEYITQ